MALLYQYHTTTVIQKKVVQGTCSFDKNGYYVAPHFFTERVDEMRIYTRTGDKGETGLFSGQRVRKDSIRVEAYGAVDELNNYIGLLRAESLPDDVDAVLMQIQTDLFTLGADLATPPGGRRADKAPRITAEHVQTLEKAIDEFDAEVPPLRSFILPAGPRPAALAHVTRGVARTAERRIVTLAGAEEIAPTTIEYVNRLSDLLFVIARLVGHRLGYEESPWLPG